MSFLAKVFGKKSGKSQSPGNEPAPFRAAQPPPKPPPPSPPPPDAPAMMKVWDAYGRVGEIPREEWRTKVLPINFRKQWDEPDQLAALINSALNDGFIPDCLEPARRLHRIDPDPRRGATFLAVILLQLKQFDEAEKVMTETIRKHGEDGVLLTNLAKAQSGKGNAALAEQTLWRALEIDPNQNNGLLWYEAIQRERGGEEAQLAALHRVAALPGSWRAQLWLSRAALKARQLEQALACYREILSRAGKPAPSDLLMQISGDLGNAGHLPEILQLIEPHFDPATHGVQVGNNLIKAYSDLGQLTAAQRVLDQLYAQNRPDWKEHLSFWDTELAKARLALAANDRKDDLSVAMLTIDGPVWLKPDSPAAELFPTQPGERVGISFIGSTVDIATNSKRTQQQLSDTPGRISRALPLFLAEQVAFGSLARVQTLVPWIMGDTPGFVLGGVPWTDEDAANHARQGELKPDYVVVTHLKPINEPWLVELRLVRTIDAKCLGRLSVSFPSAKPENGIPGLARQLLELLRQNAQVDLTPYPPKYQFPSTIYFGHYLLRLEQLLAIRCSGMDGVPPDFLHGVREIIDGNIQLCLDFSHNAVTRLLLAQALSGIKRTKPELLPEFKERIALLQKEKPLFEPAHSVLQRIFNEAQ